MDRDSRVGRFAAGTIEPRDSRSTMSLAELAQVVHDFKSPLSVVTLETQVLLHRLDDGSHAEMVDAITRVMLNIDYLDRLLEDLIDSCAIDAGRFVLHCKLTDLNELMRNVAQRMGTSCDRNRLVVEAPSSSVMIHIDALRIERVIANFVQNALKYSPAKTRVVARLDLTRPTVRVSVVDAGDGIATEDAEHLFEEYRRAPSAHAHEGSGLGLYVSKRIIEAHGGRIGVKSMVGVGSEFYFELPLH